MTAPIITQFRGLQQSLALPLKRCKPTVAVHGKHAGWACLGCGVRYTGAQMALADLGRLVMPACQQTLRGSRLERVAACK